MLMAALSILAVGFAEVTTLWPEGKIPDCQPHQIAARLEVADMKGFDAAANRKPYLQWYEAPTSNQTEQCMILISGGGYVNLCDGVWVDRFADYLTARGVQCVALNYRTPRPKGLPIYQTAWEDGQRAVRLVRSAAKRRRYDAEKIGVLGFSAGGHLAVLLATSSQTPAYACADALDDIPCHVNFAVPIFPAYVLSDGLEGPNTAKGDVPDNTLNPCFKFDAKTCPMCLIHGSDDIYSSIGSVEIYRRLHAMGISSDLHVYANRGHGFLSDNALLRSLDGWIDRVGDFLRGQGPCGGFSRWKGAVPRCVLQMDAKPGNPRNGEGDFIRLKDGRILFIYTEFVGESHKDHAAAHLVRRVSSDGGESWSEPVEAVPRSGLQNDMSVSLLRLRDGRIGLFYARKNSATDCCPVVRFSTDEGRTWGALVDCVPQDRVGYYVLNNARVEQLTSGRIVVPVARHAYRDGKFDMNGSLSCFYSDDAGETWKQGREYVVTDSADEIVDTQEPGVIELKDGRLYMYARTTRGRQWQAFSLDDGETWRDFGPSPIESAWGPATIRRLTSGELLLVWNDHTGYPEKTDKDRPWTDVRQRAPLTLAISGDEGRTWRDHFTVEGDREGFFCYFATLFEKDYLLLHYYCRSWLNDSRVTRVPLRMTNR